jgi:hypothetical protein
MLVFIPKKRHHALVRWACERATELHHMRGSIWCFLDERKRHGKELPGFWKRRGKEEYIQCVPTFGKEGTDETFSFRVIFERQAAGETFAACLIHFGKQQSHRDITFAVSFWERQGAKKPYPLFS